MEFKLLEEKEIKLIKELINMPNVNIEFNDNGFNSRAYIVNNGKIVFKFPKNPNQDYNEEIKILNRLSKIESDVKIQKINWIGENNTYVGYYGVLGKELDDKSLTKASLQLIGLKIGKFLRKMHNIIDCESYKCSIKEELEGWINNRYKSFENIFRNYFTPEEMSIINELMTEYLPNKLLDLGEKLVFSHGDLGNANVIINGDDVGIIDCVEAGYLDEAADFMDIGNQVMCDAMLDGYGADEMLRKKVEIRRLIRPFIVFKIYYEGKNKELFDEVIIKCRKSIEKYKSIKEKQVQS